MKTIATISAAPTVAMFFTAVNHPLVQLSAIMAVMVMSVRVAGRADRLGRKFFRQVDEACNPPPRRHRVFPFVALALVIVSGGCRPTAPPRTPVPIAALAEVEALDCGGRSCAIIEVAGATMITVTE